jgi:hypothetical protein
MFWNGAFRAVLSVPIRTRVADLQGPAAAHEAANLTIKRVDLRHADQRHWIEPELFRQSSDLLQTKAIVDCGKFDVAEAEPLREKRTCYAVESSVPGKPRREQFVARRFEDDRQWFGVGVDRAVHWKATRGGTSHPVAQDRGGSRGRRYLDWPVGSGRLDEAVTPHAGNSQQPERAQIASSPGSSQ